MKHILRTMFFALLALAFIQPISAQIGITVAFGPPALPIYDQPICPGDGFLWTPGYWAYDADDGYYWVPGTWVEAPEPGFLWTPAWWGWENGAFLFHEGYWANEVGFYGGIYYGFGYFGTGFEGGRWDGGHFFYNRAVLHVDVNIHNVYNTTVVHNEVVNRVSYNGGEGGITARPTDRERAVEQQRHIPPVAAQTQHVQSARSNPQMRAESNQGKPPVAATSRPGEFTGNGAVAAKAEGAPYHPAPSRAGAPAAAGNRPEGNRPEGNGSPNANPTHARDLQQHTVESTPSSGDAKADRKYQQQQQKLADQQNKEHQKLQQQQEKEDQDAAKQSNPQRQQHVEQRHQQQTQQLEQKHTQQQQQLQTRQPAPRPAPAPAPRQPR
jgi:WXXGXW repeat (2 copies)